MWTSQLLFVHLSYVLLWQSVAPNRFQCSSRTILDVLRTFQWIYLPLVEFTMFFELTIGFDSRYTYRSCICLRHLRQNTASGSNVQGIVPRMIILWESLREKWFCWKTILLKPIIDRRDKVDVRANRCLHQWATKQSLYQMMSHTTASPKYTLALTKIDNPIDTNCLKVITRYF